MVASAFSTTANSIRTPTPLFVNQQGDLQQEAQELLAKAQKLREEISASTAEGDSPASNRKSKAAIADTIATSTSNLKQSKWSVNYSTSPNTPGADADADANSIDTTATTYRLYLDIGREEGTWMDPRWGASERRIEGTLDVCFSSNPATAEVADKMVDDNQLGASSPCFMMQTANHARLKGGFDKMGVVSEQQGGYRVDGLSSSPRKSQTLRFFVTVDGTQDGDVSIPEGRLYFSLPCFVQGSSSSSNSSSNDQGSPPTVLLSNKEGIISVRQIGWHTGWRREESRILGVFRAVPIEKAQRVDGY
ncbi:MAG: hypothetical protein SGBAC_008363 [Bacillariaceae sp.]